MPSTRSSEAIEIGLVSDEPIRLQGLISVFDQPFQGVQAGFRPITGTLTQMLAVPELEFLVIDMTGSPQGLATLESIRRERPALRLIVIGPEGNDELVLDSIVAGARAYLDLTSDTEMVRQAIQVVSSGSIWAPRRLLSKLIDRLLRAPDTSLTNGPFNFTARENEVLDLILQARSNREIARHLGIEERTVKAHVSRLMRKTGADNRIELTMRALNMPLVPHTHPRGRTTEPPPAAEVQVRTSN